MVNFKFSDCVNKIVIINLFEDGEKNIEFIEIKDINDYNYLNEYINELNNNNISFEYYIRENSNIEFKIKFLKE